MEFSSPQSSEPQIYDAEVLQVSSIDLTSVEKEIEIETIRFFNYDSTFTDGQQVSRTKATALVFVVDKSQHGLSNGTLKAFRASFDMSKFGTTQWGAVDEISHSLSRKSGYPSTFISEPTRSSRILCKFTQHLRMFGLYSSPKNYALLTLNHDGDLALKRLPDLPTVKYVGYSDSDALVGLKAERSGVVSIELCYL